MHKPELAAHAALPLPLTQNHNKYRILLYFFSHCVIMENRSDMFTQFRIGQPARQSIKPVRKLPKNNTEDVT